MRPCLRAQTGIVSGGGNDTDCLLSVGAIADNGKLEST